MNESTKVFSFFTEKADRLHGFRLKGNDYIPKPFYPEEIIARIKERFESDEKDYRWGETLFSPGNNNVRWKSAKPCSITFQKRLIDGKFSELRFKFLTNYFLAFSNY